MKIAVIYYSKTGHSRKIAMAVAGGLGVQAQSVSANLVLNSVDLLFVVGGIYGGKSDPKLLKYLATLSKSQVKRAALITSSMSRSRQDMARNTLYINGIEVVSDEYILQGSLLFFGLGHPNSREIAGALAFAKKLSDGKLETPSA
jgi:flavodoxin